MSLGNHFALVSLLDCSFCGGNPPSQQHMKHQNESRYLLYVKIKTLSRLQKHQIELTIITYLSKDMIANVKTEDPKLKTVNTPIVFRYAWVLVWNGEAL